MALVMVRDEKNRHSEREGIRRFMIADPQFNQRQNEALPTAKWQNLHQRLLLTCIIRYR